MEPDACAPQSHRRHFSHLRRSKRPPRTTYIRRRGGRPYNAPARLAHTSITGAEPAGLPAAR